MKQNVIARSNTKAEFSVVVQGMCNVVWTRKLLNELQVAVKFSVKLYCDNKVVINISLNPIQHDKTKHVKVDKHFIKKK